MFFKKVKKADLEAVSSRNVDQERQENKMMRAWISFGVVIILLILLFFASINIGSLKVGFGELLSGLFVKYNKDVATIYDLRFPRIIISMLAGAAIAVSGVLFQAVLKNPLADPGIIGISSGASFTAVIITAFAPTLYFFTPIAAFAGGVVAFFMVYCLSWKGGLSPMRIILTGVAVNSLFTGLSSALNSMSGGDRTVWQQSLRRISHRRHGVMSQHCFHMWLQDYSLQCYLHRNVICYLWKIKPQEAWE